MEPHIIFPQLYFTEYKLCLMVLFHTYSNWLRGMACKHNGSTDLIVLHFMLLLATRAHLNHLTSLSKRNIIIHRKNRCLGCTLKINIHHTMQNDRTRFKRKLQHSKLICNEFLDTEQSYYWLPYIRVLKRKNIFANTDLLTGTLKLGNSLNMKDQLYMV